MKVEPITNGNYRIWLSTPEMNRWGLQENTLSQRSVTVCRLLSSVFSVIRRKTGYRQLTVEAIPVDGGCVLLVSPPPSSTEQPMVWDIADTDALLRLSRSFEAYAVNETVPSQSLYQWEEGYRLVLYPTEPLPKGMEASLREFGTPVGIGSLAVALAAEHGRFLGSGHILHRLSGSTDERHLPEPPHPATGRRHFP